jgi:DNA-binding transcriptional LysR family regulator
MINNSYLQITMINQVQAIMTFVQAARAGSFTKAARVMDVSPQAVSGTVGRLEAELGVRLMNRTTRRIHLTDEGQRFLQESELALAALDQAMNSVTEAREPNGTVRLSVSVGFGRRYVMPLIPAFRKAFPQVNVEISFDDRQVDLVRDGYDAVIRGGVITESSLISRSLCDLASVLVASPAYLKKRGVPKHYKDLDQHDLIQLRFLSGVSPNWAFQELTRKRVRAQNPAGAAGLRKPTKEGVLEEISPRGYLVLTDPESCAQAAEDGLGITAVSIHHVLPALRSGRLCIVLFDQFVSPPREVVLQYPHRALTAARVRVFVEHVTSHLQRHPDLHYKNAQLNSFLA